MSDDYKSLEHIIRNIQSKIEETTSEKKSLEHTIRDIHENFISVGKKTSKFEGLTKNKVYGDRVQPINQHAVQPKKPKGNEALEKAKETISGLAKEESSFADRTTKPIDEKKKKVDEEEPKLHSEMNVNVSGQGKFTGGQFTAAARAHPGHITPHGHSDKGEIAGAYRKRAKERAGLNRVAEEIIREGKYTPKIPNVKQLEKDADIVGDFLKNLRVAPEKTPNLPSIIDNKPIATTPKAKVPENLPANVKPKEVAPETKTQPMMQPKDTTVTDTKTKPVTPADIFTTTEPKFAKPKTTPTTADEPKLVNPSVTATEPKIAAGAPPKIGGVPPKALLPLAAGAFLGGGRGTDTDIEYHKDFLYRPPKSVGHAKAHTKHGPVKEESDGSVERKKIQNLPRPDAGDRHNIAFVGRKDDDPKTAKEKTSRQAAYKTNIIDEGKKLAGIIKSVVKDTKERREDGNTIVYPQVIINPNLKHNTMDADDSKMPVKEEKINEIVGSMVKMGAGTAAVSGLLGGGYTALSGGSKKEIKQSAIDSAKSVVTEPYRKYKEKDYWGAAADVLGSTTVPGAIADIGRLGAQTEIGQKAGKWIGDNIPGAKSAAEAAKKFRSSIGMKSTYEPSKPEEPDSTPIVPKPVKTTVEKPEVSTTPSPEPINYKPVKTTIEKESGSSPKNKNK